MIAFKLLDEREKPPPTYQEIRCHMIFDIKMEDLRRKAQYVAGGHATVAYLTLTYESVVLQDSVHIALSLSTLNDMKVKTSDIQNTIFDRSLLGENMDTWVQNSVLTLQERKPLSSKPCMVLSI